MNTSPSVHKWAGSHGQLAGPTNRMGLYKTIDYINLYVTHIDKKYMSYLCNEHIKPSTHLAYTQPQNLSLRNYFRTEERQRLDIGIEEDSIHQLDKAAQVTIFRLRTGYCQLLSHLHRLKTSHSYRSSNPQPHPAVLPQLRRFQTPDMAQSSECQQEALGTG